jgi:hypothetical protein
VRLANDDILGIANLERSGLSLGRFGLLAQ